MKRPVDCTINHFCFVAAALLLAGLTTPAFAQQDQSSSSDADSDGNGQAIFSSPLILQNARQNQSPSSGVDRVISSNPDSLQDIQPNQSSDSSVDSVISDPGAVLSAHQEQSYNGGIVDDWTHHHVIFSNPGTLEDALKKGKYGEWQSIMNDPRYRMQQARRNGRSTEGTTSNALGLRGEPIEPPFQHDPPWQYHNRRNARNRRAPLHSDWSVQIAGGAGGTTPDAFPAKYTFSPIGSPSCTNDFVVFPTGVAGSSTQAANIFGFSNLYAGTCTTGTVPTTLFAYFVGTGKLQTAPVLSVDGTKVAFVETVTNGSIFHVLKMDKSGNSGCSTSTTPCNGTAFNSPAVPGTHNSAVDTRLTMSGSVTDSISAPFVDYDGDIAYVGDDTGKLHKFTGVFTGTPAEAGSPWPFTVASGIQLTGPVFDGGASQNIFVGGSNSNLYCVTKAGAACSTASVAVGTGAIVDPPMLDSVNQKVFNAANSASNAVLLQATTSLGTPTRINIGVNGTDYYSGAFDNAYFASGPATGHMYWCGNTSSGATPELYQISFTSAGLINSATAVFGLVQSGNTGTSVDCSPLTEFFNSTAGKDYLFLSVKGHGFMSGTPNCANQTCLMSFALPTSSPFTFPLSANATTTSNLGALGTSGVIIDNASSATGTSQIYYINLQTDNAVQASQSALQ